jgi:hypothetical protein
MLSLGARIKPFGAILYPGKALVSAHYQDSQGGRICFTQDMTELSLPQTRMAVEKRVVECDLQIILPEFWILDK